VPQVGFILPINGAYNLLYCQQVKMLESAHQDRHPGFIMLNPLSRSPDSGLLYHTFCT
jgi:hypothetical protein